jgi:HD superfamily phosphohydrolase
MQSERKSTFPRQGSCRRFQQSQHHESLAHTIILPHRLIHSARVIDNQICYDIKDANTIYEMFHTRFSLHKRLYSHKTGEHVSSFVDMTNSGPSSARAIEYMVVDALLAAEPRLKLAEQIMHPEKFVNLTDDVLLSIERSAEPVSLTAS